MDLWIKDTSSVPPERWQYFVEATQYTVMVPSYGLLYQEVVKHCQANNVPPPSEQEVIQWVCANLTVDCREGKEPFVNRFSQGLPAPATSCCGGKQ